MQVIPASRFPTPGYQSFTQRHIMSLPYFYVPELSAHQVTLDEDTSKHIVQVLRMERGEQLVLTDGKGKRATAEIVDDNRKRCAVAIISAATEEPRRPHIAVAISLLKNASRYEWFLEKATEVGVNEIIPLVCARTEKEKFRHDRMQQILVSAMLQSQQSYLPLLSQPMDIKKVMASTQYEKKLIAHCLEGEKNEAVTDGRSTIILIGPEGDFTPAEIELALQNGFVPVTLGTTRLRTETAGMVASVLLRMK